MRNRAILLQVIVIFIVMIILSSCGDTSMVARVGNKAIYLNEFESSFAAAKSDKPTDTITLDEKQKHLDTMIDRQLKLFGSGEQCRRPD